MAISYAQAITPSDVEEAKRLFDEDGVVHTRIRFSLDNSSQQWELRDSATDVVVARRDAPPDAVAWTRV